MDVLKVFNLIVCTNKGNIDPAWFAKILFAPIGILVPYTLFSLIAYITIFIFSFLIFTSDSPLFSLFNRGKDGKKSVLASLISGFLLYILQTSVILLFLRFNICQRTLSWEDNDYHATLEHYNIENIEHYSGYS